eukprot:GHVH01005944.1.p1 GENE.GHVH01005944.1~~GHVH01005944.1.p1  ORF type:complete len:283 (-),score=32.72 GHVH01005944.1:95-943(-)
MSNNRTFHIDTNGISTSVHGIKHLSNKRSKSIAETIQMSKEYHDILLRIQEEKEDIKETIKEVKMLSRIVKIAIANQIVLQKKYKSKQSPQKQKPEMKTNYSHIKDIKLTTNRSEMIHEIPQSGMTGVSWYRSYKNTYWVAQWHQYGRQCKELFSTGKPTPSHPLGSAYCIALKSAIRRRQEMVKELCLRSRNPSTLPPLGTIRAFDIPDELYNCANVIDMINEMLNDNRLTEPRKSVGWRVLYNYDLRVYFSKRDTSTKDNSINDTNDIDDPLFSDDIDYQ